MCDIPIKCVTVTHTGALSAKDILEKLEKWSNASGKGIGEWEGEDGEAKA